MKITIAKLERPVHCGDWHDGPMRWVVSCDPALPAEPASRSKQLFRTKSDARLFARLWRKNKDLSAAIRAFVNAHLTTD